MSSDQLKRLIQEQVKEEIIKIKPEIETVLLDDISRGIRKILTHLEETTPDGVTVELPEKTVTATETINLLRDYPYRPLRKIYFYNKGPDTAYIRINDDGKEVSIENRENIVVERPKATIEFFTLRVDSGNTATIRPKGFY